MDLDEKAKKNKQKIAKSEQKRDLTVFCASTEGSETHN